MEARVRMRAAPAASGSTLSDRRRPVMHFETAATTTTTEAARAKIRRDRQTHREREG